MLMFFIGAEAAQIHGLDYAIHNVADIMYKDYSELEEAIKYQKDHGMKLLWIVPDMSYHNHLIQKK